MNSRRLHTAVRFEGSLVNAFVFGARPGESVSGREAVAESNRLAASAAPARFHALIMPHLDAAYSLARYLIRDPLAAEDVTQDAFLSAFRGLDGLRGEAVKPWLMAIVRNACFDHLRRNRSWEDHVVRGQDG